MRRKAPGNGKGLKVTFFSLSVLELFWVQGSFTKGAQQPPSPRLQTKCSQRSLQLQKQCSHGGFGEDVVIFVRLLFFSFWPYCYSCFGCLFMTGFFKFAFFCLVFVLSFVFCFFPLPPPPPPTKSTKMQNKRTKMIRGLHGNNRKSERRFPCYWMLHLEAKNCAEDKREAEADPDPRVQTSTPLSPKPIASGAGAAVPKKHLLTAYRG